MPALADHQSHINVKTIVAVLALSASSLSVAALNEEQRWLELPASIYVNLSDDPLLDRDADGLKDDYENRLADAWRPYFVFDQNENSRQHCSTVSKIVETTVSAPCGVVDTFIPGDFCEKLVEKTVVETVCKNNVDDDSLRAFEPVVIYQVRPIAEEGWPRRLKIQWAFLYRLDGGYRESNVCTNYHYGDTQSGQYELLSYDGIRWSIDKLDLWAHKGKVAATSGAIEWTSPRSTYWGKMPDRPSPKIYASAGKHHQYISAQACEDEPGACDDDCGGGAERLANLVSQGGFNNVGEFQMHPSYQGSNQPFLTNLKPVGFPGELVWDATGSCHCPLATTAAECFTGGLGSSWTASAPPQSCDTPTPVYKLFDLQSAPRPPMELGPLFTILLF